MTRAEFIVRFPEFTPTDTTMVDAHLAAAELDVADTWGDDQREEVIALRTASSLATTPFGREARLVDPKTGISTYDRQLQRMNNAHACALNRIG